MQRHLPACLVGADGCLMISRHRQPGSLICLKEKTKSAPGHPSVLRVGRELRPAKDTTNYLRALRLLHRRGGGADHYVEAEGLQRAFFAHVDRQQHITRLGHEV